MRYSLKIIAILMTICVGAAGQPPFAFKRAINGVEKEGWYALPLPAEMFVDLNKSLSDIRLYSINDADTTEIPYVLKIRQDQVTSKSGKLSVLNKSERDGSLYLTFQVPASQQLNSLRLTFLETEFFAYVTLEGSDDRKDWFEIVKDVRIASLGDDHSLADIRFPISEYRYLRARVKSDTNLRFDNAAFSFDSVTAGRYHNVPLKWGSRLEKTSRRTIVDMTAPQYGPVSLLKIELDEDKDYHRSFILEYVTDSTHTDKGWIRYYQRATEGFITSFRENRFAFPVVFAKHFRLIINDRDNASLRIRDLLAEGPDVELLAHLKPGSNFVFYGKEFISAPDYDLARFQNKIPETLILGSVGAEERLSVEKGKPGALFENPVWLWSIMIVMIAGLAFFTLKMMKSKV